MTEFVKYNQRIDRSKELEGDLMQEDQAEKHIDPISGDLFSIAAIIDRARSAPESSVLMAALNRRIFVLYSTG